MTIRYVELMLFGFDNTNCYVLNNDQIVKGATPHKWRGRLQRKLHNSNIVWLINVFRSYGQSFINTYTSLREALGGFA